MKILKTEQNEKNQKKLKEINENLIKNKYTSAKFKNKKQIYVVEKNNNKSYNGNIMNYKIKIIKQFFIMKIIEVSLNLNTNKIFNTINSNHNNPNINPNKDQKQKIGLFLKKIKMLNNMK